MLTLLAVNVQMAKVNGFARTSAHPRTHSPCPLPRHPSPVPCAPITLLFVSRPHCRRMFHALSVQPS
eukprot:4835235-Pleurochrysis_carterae.AAC.1